MSGASFGCVLTYVTFPVMFILIMSCIYMDYKIDFYKLFKRRYLKKPPKIVVAENVVNKKEIVDNGFEKRIGSLIFKSDA